MKEVKDLNNKDLAVFTSLNESQLAHYYEPNLGLFVAESKNVILRAINRGYEPEILLIEDKVIDTIDGKEVLNKVKAKNIYYGKKEVLCNITGYNLTSGILCSFKRKKLKDLSELLNNSSRVVILENIQNPANMGSIFRNAAALGIDAILLTKDSTDPLYKRSSRVSMGNVFNIDYGFIEDIKEVKKYGFKLVAMALRENTIDIDDEKLKKEDKLAIILGSEGNGLKKETIKEADYVVKISMNNEVDSLNVAACSAISFYVFGQ